MFRRAPAVRLIIQTALKPRQVRLLMLPRHQEPMSRRERLAQHERQVVDPSLMTTVSVAGVDQASAVKHQHLAFVASDVQQGLQGVESILPRIDFAVDAAELPQENLDFELVLRILVDKLVESNGDALELAGLPLLGFSSLAEVAAVEGRHLGAIRQLGLHDLRSETRNVTALRRGQVQHR
ncbi:hypothetical protein PG993_003653 [Apiospora rasikravindrae]|uniref:Uncharacterized protein n=1 Tax=Apiospora rasikravindrae TaxID=990691 RepID=A0ABR1U0C6_9PEZI